MTWILTCTGTEVDLRLLEPQTLSVIDIAHALANINRYTGHAVRPYSVAEHSLLVVEIMEREFGITNPAVLLGALMHDAHEAYIGDLSSPLKEVLGPTWQHTERRVQISVLDRFGLLEDYLSLRQLIKRADLMALATERAALLPPGGAPWPSLHDVAPPTWAKIDLRSAMTWEDWRDAFIERFASLYVVSGLQSLHPVDVRSGTPGAEMWHFPS